MANGGYLRKASSIKAVVDCLVTTKHFIHNLDPKCIQEFQNAEHTKHSLETLFFNDLDMNGPNIRLHY